METLHLRLPAGPKCLASIPRPGTNENGTSLAAAAAGEHHCLYSVVMAVAGERTAASRVTVVAQIAKDKAAAALREVAATILSTGSGIIWAAVGIPGVEVVAAAPAAALIIRIGSGDGVPKEARLIWWNSGMGGMDGT